MKTKFIAKQVKATGKWAVFQRVGSRKAGFVDTFFQDVEQGMHTACRIAEGLNRGGKGE